MLKLVTRCVSVLVLMCSVFLGHGPSSAWAYEIEADFAIITVNPAPMPGNATNRLGEAVSAVPTVWDWTSGNLLGWSGSGISGLTATGGSITGTGTTASPFIQITGFSGPDLDFGFYDYLQLRIRLPAGFGGDVICRFGTSTQSGNNSADREFLIPNARLINDGQWHTYRVDLGLIPRYRDQLTDLRVYPLGNQGSGATFEIDYVEIGDRPGDFLWVNTNINKPESVPEADVRHQSSKHATIWWAEGSGITAEHTRRALRMIEESHQVFTKILGYQEPFENWDLRLRDGKRYKVNHVTWFSGYWMGGRAGFGYFNVPRGGLGNEGWGNPVPHEYAHVVQGHQINFLLGRHWESHANYLRQAWQMHNAWRFSAGQKSALQLVSLINSNFRQDHGRLIYNDYRIHHALEEMTEIGLDPHLPARLWYEGQKDRTCYLELADRLPAGHSVPDVVARGLRRWPFLDFQHAALFRDQLWRTANDKAWHDYITGSLLIPSQDRPGWWRVPFARAPERFAYMYHEIDATSSSVTVELQGIDVMGTTEGWRWSLAAMDGSGNVRYSDVFTPGTRTMSLQAGETKVYLIVVATPTNNTLNLEWTDNRLPTDRHLDRLRYPYEVRIVGATPAKRQLDWNTTAGSIHPNGGGWKANTATVHGTAYVGPNARVLGSAQVRDNARIEDYAVVAENAIVSDNAVVSGYAVVRGSSQVRNNARMRDRAVATGTVQVLDQSMMTEYAHPSGNLALRNYAIARGQAISYRGNITGDTILDYDCSTGHDMSDGVQFNHVPWGGWYEDYWWRTKSKPWGLVASYRIDESEGRMVWDEFGVAHALLRGNGQRVYDELRHTQVMRLDGSSAYLVLDRNLCALRSATYSLWVKPNGTNTDRAVLFMGGASNRFLRIVPRDGNGRARVRIASGATATEWLSQSEIPQNAWTHLAFTLDADTGLGVLYVNGQPQDSKTSSLRPEQVLGPNDYVNGEALYVGRDWDGNLFAGDVVDLRVFNVALSDQEIETSILRSGSCIGAFFADAPRNFNGSSTEFQSGVIDGLQRMLKATIYPRASSNNDYYEAIFDSSDERTASLRGSGFGLRNGRIFVRLANVGFWDTGVNATMNQWQTITLTYNGSQARLYINGTQRATHIYTANQSHVAGKNFRIGFAQSASSGNPKYYFNGEIRDAFIYDNVDVALQSAPAAPASIAYPSSSSTGQYTVEWAAADGATIYQLDRSANGGSTWTQVYYGAATSYGERVGSGSYRYRVRAENIASSSAWRTGGHDCVVTILGIAITRPASETVYIDDDSVRLRLIADGAPSGEVSYAWSATRADGSATFEHVNQADTSVTLTGRGTYILRVTSTLYGATAIDEVTVVLKGTSGSLSPDENALWYRFDETSGTQAADHSGHNRHGTLINGPVWTSAGKVNGALIFDGVDDYVLSPEIAVAGDTGWTAMAWVYRTGASGVQNNILSQEDGVRTGRIWLSVRTNGEVFSFLGGTGIQAGNVTMGNWHHVAITIGAGTDPMRRLYVDGVEVAASARTIEAVNAPFRVGAHKILADTNNPPWQGTIDELRLYRRDLSAAEIALSASSPTHNIAPFVSAGIDGSGSVGSPVALDGEVSDDGRPLPQPVIQWTKASGPGEVVFENPAQPQTTVTFDAAGTYVLRLSAYDGDVEVFDEMSCVVMPISKMDIWCQEQFGVNAGNDAIAGPLADPNQDGVVNLLKFALRGDPHADDRAEILPRLERNSAGGGPVFIFRVRHMDGQFANDGYIADGLLYQVQRSTGPGAGAWVLHPFTEENIIWAVDADDAPMLEVAVDGAEPQTEVFFELRVILMDTDG